MHNKVKPNSLLDFFLASGLITKEQLKNVSVTLSRDPNEDQKLGLILLRFGYINNEMLRAALILWNQHKKTKHILDINKTMRKMISLLEYRLPVNAETLRLETEEDVIELFHRGSLIAALKESNKAYQKELSAARPTADAIIITAGNEDMQKAYKRIFFDKQTVTHRNDIPIIIIYDPDEKRAGNAGALGNALREFSFQLPILAGKFPHLKSRSILDLRIVIIQAGGFGRRHPATISNGSKTLMQVPIILSNGQMASVMDVVMQGSYKFTQELVRQGRSGLVVLNGDGLLTTTPQIRDEISAIGYLEDMNLAVNRLGIIIRDENNKIFRFIEKPTHEEMAKDNLLQGDPIYQEGRVIANTASFIISVTDKTKYARALDGLFKIGEIVRSRNTDENYEIDTSNDIFIPLTVSRENYLARKTNGKEKEFYNQVYDVVTSNLPALHVVGMNERTFYKDIGDAEVFLTEMIPGGLLSKLYGFKGMIDSYIAPGARVHKKTKIYLSYLHADIVVGEGSVVYGSELLPGSKIGRKSIVYKAKGKIQIGDNQIFFQIPVNSKGWAQVYMGIRDDSKATIRGGKATICGEPIVKWIRKKKLITTQKSKKICVDFLKARDIKQRETLWTLPVWPIHTHRYLRNMQTVSWIAASEEPIPSSYLKCKKMSLAQIIENLNYGAISHREKSISQKITHATTKDNIGKLNCK